MTDEELVKLVESSITNKEYHRKSKFYFCSASDGRFVIATYDVELKEIRYHWFEVDEIRRFISDIHIKLNN